MGWHEEMPMTAIVTHLGALPGECILSSGIVATGETLATSKGDVTVRVWSRNPYGIFLSYDGPALTVGDTVEVGDPND
jgi:hypothetical protein